MKNYLQNKKIQIAYPFLITFVLLFIVFAVNGITPFGSSTLAVRDANIQYLDFFAYLKNTLHGDGGFGYSFSKTLGGNLIGVFSYYLASPFSLLVYFFPKENFHDFFSLLILLKLSISSMFFYLFLNKRFNSISSKTNLLFILLSIGYGLSNYNLTQSNNIMWIDGAYMLPLILLGVYRITQGDKLYKLTIPVALSIVFNWYTGGINCLFSFFWFLLEVSIKKVENKLSISDSFRLVIRYIIAMLLGVLISMCIFLPTIYAMLNSNRGTFDLSELRIDSFIGNVFTLFQGLSINAYNDQSRVSLFCGALGFVGWIHSLFFAKIDKRMKIVFLVFSILCILIFYWYPLYFLFSLLKPVGSFWCRYSFVGIAFILFIAAYGYNNESITKKSIIYSSLLCSFILIVSQIILGGYRTLDILLSVVFIIINGILILIYFKNSKFHTSIFSFLLSIFVLLELGVNSYLIYKNKKLDLIETYKIYYEQEEIIFSTIKNLDDSKYRINQTSTKGQYILNNNTNHRDVQATYNESLNYGFWSLSGYTSSPDDVQRVFLDRSGYRINGENMNIVNTSQIAIDSLLGVRYVVSKDNIEELQKVNYNSVLNKQIYKNTYSLPMVFTVPNSTKGDIGAYTNSFEYQNAIYQQLSQNNTDILKKLDYDREYKDYQKEGFIQTYSIKPLKGNYAYYGNIPWHRYMQADVDVNSRYTMNYSCWLSPAVFYIPSYNNQESINVQVTSEWPYSIDDVNVEYYALDLDEFKSQIQTIRDNNHVKDYSVEDGLVTATIESLKDEKVFTSIPYDRGWICTVNGEEVKPELFADCFYLIPVKKGTNEIKMTYSIPGLKLGISLSLVGLLLLSTITYNERRKI